MMSEMELPEFLYSRICSTARAVSDIAEREIECMGYLLQKKGSLLITDFFFPKQNGMDARSGTSDFPPRDMYEKGFYIAGMWHSHGAFPLFHSEIDYAHIANKLKAMEREYKTLGSWLSFSSGNEIAMYNKETMQGFKIMLKDNLGAQADKTVPEINVKEVFPDEFLSIVVNEGVYRNGKKPHAMKFSLDGSNLLKSKEETGIIPSLPDETLEEIAEKFYFNGKPLKESGNYKQINAPKAKAEGKQVHLNCKKGNFLFECKNKEEANELQESILSVEELGEQEKKEISARIPKPLSLEQNLGLILKKKTTAIAPEKQYASNDDYLNGSKEFHLFYVGKFLALLPYYTRAELESEKAVLDLLAAVAGVFDDAETREEAIKARAVKIKQACRKIKAADKSAKEALKKAGEIIRGGDYSKDEKRKILARLRMIRKKNAGEKEMKNGLRAGRSEPLNGVGTK
ncbi:MAG: hypothetical protein PHO02_02065 [Candidatus Nanoarchaeia archaeon]|nr:hypothetical protein [Candidatus Nanoarchaeia archaeon]